MRQLSFNSRGAFQNNDGGGVHLQAWFLVASQLGDDLRSHLDTLYRHALRKIDVLGLGVYTVATNVATTLVLPAASAGAEGPRRTQAQCAEFQSVLS